MPVLKIEVVQIEPSPSDLRRETELLLAALNAGVPAKDQPVAESESENKKVKQS